MLPKGSGRETCSSQPAGVWYGENRTHLQVQHQLASRTPGVCLGPKSLTACLGSFCFVSVPETVQQLSSGSYNFNQFP